MRVLLLAGTARAVSAFTLFNTQKPIASALKPSSYPTSSLNFHLKEVPGGTPLSFCPQSSPTDLFNITYAEVTKQPLYMSVQPRYPLFKTAAVCVKSPQC